MRSFRSDRTLGPTWLADSRRQSTRASSKRTTFAPFLGIAASVSREAEVRTAERSISVTPLEPDSFFYQRAVFATPRATSALNWAFADRIAQRPDLLEDPGLKFLVGFTGATVHGIQS